MSEEKWDRDDPLLKEIFEIHLFHVRLRSFDVDRVPDHLQVYHYIDEPYKHLEVNGKKVEVSNGVYVTLRREWTDRERSIATFTSTDNVRINPYGVNSIILDDQGVEISCASVGKWLFDWKKGGNGIELGHETDRKTGFMVKLLDPFTPPATLCLEKKPKGRVEPSLQVYVAGCSFSGEPAAMAISDTPTTTSHEEIFEIRRLSVKLSYSVDVDRLPDNLKLRYKLCQHPSHRRVEINGIKQFGSVAYGSLRRESIDRDRLEVVYRNIDEVRTTFEGLCFDILDDEDDLITFFLLRKVVFDNRLEGRGRVTDLRTRYSLYFTSTCEPPTKFLEEEKRAETFVEVCVEGWCLGMPVAMRVDKSFKTNKLNET